MFQGNTFETCLYTKVDLLLCISLTTFPPKPLFEPIFTCLCFSILDLLLVLNLMCLRLLCGLRLQPLLLRSQPLPFMTRADSYRSSKQDERHTPIRALPAHLQRPVTAGTCSCVTTSCALRTNKLLHTSGQCSAITLNLNNPGGTRKSTTRSSDTFSRRATAKVCTSRSRAVGSPPSSIFVREALRRVANCE